MPQRKTTTSQKPVRQKQASTTATPRPKRRSGPAGRTAAAARDGQPGTARTKSATVLDLLSRNGGATLDEMMNATNWQAHSVRGFLSGTVKKKLGLPLTSDRGDDGIRRYAIEATDA